MICLFHIWQKPTNMKSNVKCPNKSESLDFHMSLPLISVDEACLCERLETWWCRVKNVCTIHHPPQVTTLEWDQLSIHSIHVVHDIGCVHCCACYDSKSGTLRLLLLFTNTVMLTFLCRDRRRPVTVPSPFYRTPSPLRPSCVPKRPASLTVPKRPSASLTVPQRPLASLSVL